MSSLESKSKLLDTGSRLKAEAGIEVGIETSSFVETRAERGFRHYTEKYTS